MIDESLMAEIAPHVATAIRAQMMRWDAELAIERILGRELETEETIKVFACAFNTLEEVNEASVRGAAREIINSSAESSDAE